MQLNPVTKKKITAFITVSQSKINLENSFEKLRDISLQEHMNGGAISSKGKYKKKKVMKYLMSVLVLN